MSLSHHRPSKRNWPSQQTILTSLITTAEWPSIRLSRGWRYTYTIPISVLWILVLFNNTYLLINWYHFLCSISRFPRIVNSFSAGNVILRPWSRHCFSAGHVIFRNNQGPYVLIQHRDRANFMNVSTEWVNTYQVDLFLIFTFSITRKWIIVITNWMWLNWSSHIQSVYMTHGIKLYCNMTLNGNLNDWLIIIHLSAFSALENMQHKIEIQEWVIIPYSYAWSQEIFIVHVPKYSSTHYPAFYTVGLHSQTPTPTPACQAGRRFVPIDMTHPGSEPPTHCMKWNKTSMSRNRSHSILRNCTIWFSI